MHVIKADLRTLRIRFTLFLWHCMAGRN